MKDWSFHIRERYRRFRAWQESPFNYAMDEERARCCHNCGREYTGNFCPCCGQKATLGVVNWATVRENVMEIWGMGTRSMTYTLWQLFLRPGYLIRDYISGKRQVSFPPVKMLLIVAIVCAVITELLGLDSPDQAEPAWRTEPLMAFFTWVKANRGWGSLIIYSAIILPTWILFRHSPRCTAHSLPQGFFIQVFLCTLVLIFSTLAKEDSPINVMIPLYFIVAYYQLFGYGLWGTIWRIFACFVSAAFFIMMIVFVAPDVKLDSSNTMPGWLLKTMLVAIFGILNAALLVIGYGIGRWTQRKRLKKQKPT